MAAIAAANVTLTPQGKGTKEYNKSQVIKIVFGNGTLTYPSLGVPLTGLKSMGFPNNITSVSLYSESPGDGYVYKYDSVNQSLRIYQIGALSANTPLTELGGAAAPAATTLFASVAGY